MMIESIQSMRSIGKVGRGGTRWDDHPWTCKNNRTIFQKKRYYSIQDYLTVELDPPIKRKNKHDHLQLELIMLCYRLFQLSKI